MHNAHRHTQIVSNSNTGISVPSLYLDRRAFHVIGQDSHYTQFLPCFIIDLTITVKLASIYTCPIYIKQDVSNEGNCIFT